MRTRRSRKWEQRLLSVFLSMMLLLGMLPIRDWGIQSEVEAAGVTLLNPGTDNGKVTWDCIWFGSYPQAEVVPSANYTAVNSSYLKSGDIIVDNSLYQTLKSADGWDYNEDIIINGEKYRRMRKYQATYIGSNSAYYYQWADATTYHYFKYQPIKWRILKIDGNMAMILADKALDDRQFNTVKPNPTWEKSTVRSFLNGYNSSYNKQGVDFYGTWNFLYKAFGSSGRAALCTTKVVQSDSYYTSNRGNDTFDKVFLLSDTEAQASQYGLNNSVNRYCKSSTYAKAMGAFYSLNSSYIGNCCWWLRSSGPDFDSPRDVYYYGNVGSHYHVYNPDFAVRPAAFLNLKYTNLYTYAGTVCSDGKISEVGRDTASNESVVVENSIKSNLNDMLQDIHFASGEIKGPEFEVMDGKYKFSPFNFDFRTEILLSKLKFNAVIEDSTKTVKVILGYGKDSEAEITQTSKKIDSSWGKQFNDIKSLYKEMTGSDMGSSNKKGTYWNKFQKLKSDLNRIKCDMLISADMSVCGYIEFDYSSGSLVYKEGGIIEEVTAGTEIPFPICGKFVYTALGLEVGESGTIAWTNNKTFETKLELKATATAKIVGEIPMLAKIEGGLNASLKGTLSSTDPKFSMGMDGSVFIKGSALQGMITFFDISKKYVDCQIYPEFKNNLGKKISVMNAKTFDNMLESAEETPRILNSSSDRTVNLSGQDFVKNNVYEYNDAKLLELNDGRMLLLWIDDTGLKNDKNLTSLLYSVYDGGGWSESQTVAEDGCFFGEFDACTDSDGNVNVIFQKGIGTFEEDEEYTEMVRVIDPYFIRFDGNGFSEPVKLLGDNSDYETNYHISNQDGISVSWVSYSSDYMSGDSEYITITCMQIQDGQTGEKIQYNTQNQIMHMALQGDKVFAVEQDGQQETFIYSYEDGQENVIDTLEVPSKLVCADNNLFYLNGNVLCIYDGNTVTSTNMEQINDFQMVTNQGRTKVITEFYDGNTSGFYAADVSDKEIGDFELIMEEDRFVKQYESILDEKGKVKIIATLCDMVSMDSTTEFQNLQLKLCEKETVYDIGTDYIDYDMEAVKPDSDLSVAFNMINKGNQEINDVTAILLDEKGNILAQKEIPCELMPGDEMEETVIYHLPENISYQTWKLRVNISETERNLSDNEASTEVGFSDLNISNLEFTQNCTNNVITGKIQNDGYDCAKNISINIGQNTIDGRKTLETIEIANMEPGEEKIFQMEVDDAELQEVENGCDISIFAEAESDTMESDLLNNENILLTTYASNRHHMDKIDAVPASSKNGNIEYWICSECGAVFRDSEALEEIQMTDTVIPMSAILKIEQIAKIKQERLANISNLSYDDRQNAEQEIRRIAQEQEEKINSVVKVEEIEEILENAEQVFDEALKNVFQITIVRTITFPENAGLLAGGGEYLFDSTVMLTAKPVKGYTFAGWYKGNIEENSIPSEKNKVSTVPSCEIQALDNDTVYTAYFTPNKDKNLSIITGQGSVTYAYHEKNKSIANDMKNNGFPIGTYFTVTANPNTGYDFLYWTDETTGRILSDLPEYRFYLSDNTSIRACYKSSQEATCYVVFKDMNGRVLQAGDVEKGSAAIPPETGNFNGKCAERYGHSSHLRKAFRIYRICQWWLHCLRTEGKLFFCRCRYSTGGRK